MRTATPEQKAKAAKLQTLADGLTGRIEALRRDRLENTPKRQREGMAARCEAGNLERVQRALSALAAGWEAGTVPAKLQGLRSKAAIEPLVTRALVSHSYYHVAESDAYRSDTPEARALRAFVDGVRPIDPAAQAERVKSDRVRALEEEIRFSPIPGFFPTPPALVEILIAAADLCPGLKVLEPSAGKGDLADAIDAAGADVLCFELVPKLAEILKTKGHACDCGDFMTMPPAPEFDRVLMNPPFENGQDMAHVMQAAAWLRPGGRLVTVIGAGWMMDRGQRFRAWLEGRDYTSEENDPAAFKDAFRSTSVRTYTLTINA